VSSPSIHRNSASRPGQPTQPAAATSAGPAAPAGTSAPPTALPVVRDSFSTGGGSGAPQRSTEQILQDAVAARQARSRTTQLHVERGIQSDAARYESDLPGWLQEAGDRLAAREVTLRLSDKLQITGGADLRALQERAGTDLRGLAADLGVGVRSVGNYLADLHQLVDDLLAPGTQTQRGVIDAAPGSELGRAIGLDRARTDYGAPTTRAGQLSAAEVLRLRGVELSAQAVEKLDLTDKVYMDSATFGGQRTSSDRSSVELEVVKQIGGLDSQALLSLARAERGGRSVFDRMAKPVHAEALSLGYSGLGIDEMRWDADAHALREQNAYVSLTVEPGRFRKDAGSGEWEVTVGKDYNIDRYYDTPDHALLGSEMSLRTRVRMDTPGEIRRILVQSKLGSSVDENGVKSAEKKDIRVDMAKWEEAEKLDEAVRSGLNRITRWEPGRPIEAVQAVYEGLKDKDLLPDIGEKKDVLLLEEKAVIFSTRNRYHLNFTSESAIKGLIESCGKPMIGRARELAEASTRLDPAAKAELVAMARGLEDGSLLARACEAELRKLDPAMTVDPTSVQALLPEAPGAADKLSVFKRQVVADAQSRLYHELAAKLAGAARDISGSGRRAREMAAGFKDWQKSVDPALRAKTTARPFVDALERLQSSAELDAQLAAYNAYAQQNRHPEIGRGDLERLSWGLVEEDLGVMSRQIEAAGSAGQALWFRQAAGAFVPGRSEWGNFLIDTFDLAEAVKPEEFDRLTQDQQHGKEKIPQDKVFRASIVNELQIELGLEKPYLERIGALKREIAEGKDTPETRRELEMCEFIYKRLMDAQENVAMAREARIRREAERVGVTGITWGNVESSKGDGALLALLAGKG
jgi:hypothetical protein